MQFVIKHCQTRWLSLDKVPLGIIEQQENLKEYFLKTLPKLSFIVHVCQDFKKFVVPLQSTELKIHVLCTKCVKLVRNLLSRFVKNDSFMKQTKMLPKEEIIQVINQEEKRKVYH